MIDSKIFAEVAEERQRQDAKWGVQNHPILVPGLLDTSPEMMAAFYRVPTEAHAKMLCERSFVEGDGSYMGIIVEELAEVVACMDNKVTMRAELVQLAACCVAAIAALDRS